MRSPLSPIVVVLAGAALALDVLGALIAWLLLPAAWT